MKLEVECIKYTTEVKRKRQSAVVKADNKQDIKQKSVKADSVCPLLIFWAYKPAMLTLK